MNIIKKNKNKSYKFIVGNYGPLLFNSIKYKSNFTSIPEKKYKPNFILIPEKKHFLQIIFWQFRMPMVHVKSPRFIISYVERKSFLAIYIITSKFLSILDKHEPVEITDVYHHIRHIFRVFKCKIKSIVLDIKETNFLLLFRKFKCRTKLIVLDIKEINFILIFPSSLLIILWKNRMPAVSRNINKNYIIKYIMKFLSIYLSKWYINCVNYLEEADIIIQKVIRNFSLNKERTFIEYQLNVQDYSWPSSYLFGHLCKHTLGIYYLLSSIRIDSYIFIPNKESPERKRLYFNRLKVDESSSNIKLAFQIAQSNYDNAFSENEDSYDSDTTGKDISHVALRLYFKRPPVKTELLQIEPLIYYAKFSDTEEINIHNKTVIKPTIVSKKINKISIKSLADQAFTESGYDEKEVQFILTSDKNKQ